MKISYIISPPNGPVDSFRLILCASEDSDFYEEKGWYIGSVSMNIKNRAAWIEAHPGKDYWEKYSASVNTITKVTLELPDALSTEEVISHIIQDFHAWVLKNDHPLSHNKVASNMLKEYAKQMLDLDTKRELDIPEEVFVDLKKYQEQYQEQSFSARP